MFIVEKIDLDALMSFYPKIRRIVGQYHNLNAWFIKQWITKFQYRVYAAFFFLVTLIHQLLADLINKL